MGYWIIFIFIGIPLAILIARVGWIFYLVELIIDKFKGLFIKKGGK